MSIYICIYMVVSHLLEYKAHQHTNFGNETQPDQPTDNRTLVLPDQRSDLATRQLAEHPIARTRRFEQLIAAIVWQLFATRSETKCPYCS